MSYRVVRFYFDKPGYQRTIIARCSLEEAQRHCSDPETSSNTAKGSWARRRTRLHGRWFDGYEER